LLQNIEVWREESAIAIGQDSDCFPTWFCKRIAFVAVRGGSVRDVLVGKQLSGPRFDILMDIVSQWRLTDKYRELRLQHQGKSKKG